MNYAYAIPQYSLHSIAVGIATQHETDWKHHTETSWTTTATPPTLPPEWPPTKIEHTHDTQRYVIQDENGVIYLAKDHPRNHLYMAAWGRDHTWVNTWKTRILTHYPEAKGNDALIPVKISYNTKHGPRSWQRILHAPTWETCRKNYPKTTQDHLTHLLQQPPTDGGRLLLWDGPPGTGKTYAIRALMNAWRNTTRFIFILDPEELFTRDPGYLIDTITESTPHASQNERIVLVLEDAGELLAADARDRVGQGLSRLLNLVDGILGQGLNLMVLITTNESIHTFHPAVTRPGRCIQAINFPPLPKMEATEWLKHHNLTTSVGEDVTLAELYRLLHGRRENGMTNPRRETTARGMYA